MKMIRSSSNNFLFSFFFVFFIISPTLILAQNENLVITSGYSNLFQFYVLDLEASEPTMYDFGAQEVDDPNLTFSDTYTDGRTIYTVHEVNDYDGSGRNTGAVSRWLKGRTISGKPQMNQMQTVSFVNGSGPAHVKIHNDFGLLHVSNYGAGSFVSFSLDDSGEIMEQVYAENFGKGSGVKPDRQMESHPHGAWTYGPFVYVADLGSDKIWHYIASPEGALSKANPEYTSTPAGYGPRHMAIHEDLKIAYVIFELESFIGIYGISDETGELTEREMVPILDNGGYDAGDYAAEIEISPDKNYLYASTRKSPMSEENGAMVVFAIGADGSLSKKQIQPVIGNTPRHFKIHPNNKMVLVGLQNALKLQVFKIDDTTGLLSEGTTMDCPSHPTMVSLLNL